MLEMGEPVPIIDLARRMIQLSGGRVGVDIQIKVIGIRPGEKLCEDLREPDEEVLETEHPSISRLLPVTTPKAWFDSCLGQLAEAMHAGTRTGCAGFSSSSPASAHEVRSRSERPHPDSRPTRAMHSGSRPPASGQRSFKPRTGGT